VSEILERLSCGGLIEYSFVLFEYLVNQCRVSL
jgi:hypothetical protein